MDVVEDRAYAYWKFLEKIHFTKRLWEKKLLHFEDYERRVEITRRMLVLDEPSEVLKDESYQAALEAAYGLDAESCPIPSIQARYRTRQAANVNPKYRCLVEIVKRSTRDITPSYALQCWLRERNTIQYLKLWEEGHNPKFNAGQAEALIAELHHTNSSMTLKKWIERTGATGIVSLPGRYGGTYADPIIATAFESWLLPEYFYFICKHIVQNNSRMV